jgi:hypothetical protein
MPFTKGHPFYKGGEKGWFKKGLIPWSKSQKGITLNTGRTHIKKGQRISPSTEFKKGGNLEEDNFKWKGNDVKYGALHSWVKRRLGKAKCCEMCGIKNGKYEWANKSQKYKRELSDWISLCLSCHRKYDKKTSKTNTAD